MKINQQTVNWDDMALTLKTIFDARADKTAFLKADGDLEFQEVAEVLDAVHHAGGGAIGLMTR